MGETTTTTTKGTPPVDPGQSSGGKDGSTSTTPESYTREEALKLVSDALTEQGRKHKGELEAMSKERDTHKSKASELSDIAEERDALQKQIEELSSKDPEVFNLVKKDKELRERERKLKADAEALSTDKKSHEERIKLAEDTLREISIWEIAAEYEGGNPVKLKDLCDIFSATSEEQIRNAANTLWTKKPGNVSKTNEGKPYSGMTSGGRNFNRDPKNPDETLRYGFNQIKKK